MCREEEALRRPAYKEGGGRDQDSRVESKREEGCAAEREVEVTGKERLSGVFLDFRRLGLLVYIFFIYLS